jgi:formylglycine-generating enzyme required for sulfatase activity
MTLTLAAVMWVVWFYVFRSNERMLEEEVFIPAGDYIVGADAELVHLDAFSIDKYEVTIGQYANFLAYLEQHPTTQQDFNHPRQPRYLEHRPKDWAIYYGRAKAGRPVHGVPTDLNSPMMMVTWWDAYAYAKWKGRELPTEQQWEAAGRGPKGLLYPWGDEMDPKKVNSNADYDAAYPNAPGKVDGYNFWSAVDAIGADRSPFGVVGLAGNVSEWVATWTPDNRFPVLKGGNFTSADVRLDKRYVDRDASKPEEFIGFRTVSNKPAQTTQ